MSVEAGSFGRPLAQVAAAAKRTQRLQDPQLIVLYLYRPTEYTFSAESSHHSSPLPPPLSPSPFSPSRCTEDVVAMGKYYCDYCDVHLTHDSASGELHLFESSGKDPELTAPSFQFAKPTTLDVTT